MRASEEILYTNAALKRKLCKVVAAVDMESEIRDVGGGTEEEGEESGRERAEREESLSKHLRASLLFFHFFLADLFFARLRAHKKKKKKSRKEKKNWKHYKKKKTCHKTARVIREEEEESERREKKNPREGRQFVLERAATRI